MAFDTTNLIPRLIDLDFKQVKFCSVSVEQYDKDSTYLDVSLYDDGNVYTIPVGTTVSFGGTKPSSHIVLETAVIENNKIYYKISEQCTVKEGDYPVKFTLYLPNGAVKYTQEFKIQVRKAVISSDAIADVDEVNVLNELIVDASGAITNANTATTNATTATGLANTATTNANNATTSANNAATLANTKAGLANTATTNANTATTSANNAATLANEKAGLAVTATTNAINATNNANTATTNANNAADSANDIATQLETETLKIFKDSVDTYTDLATTYPAPENGWTVTVGDESTSYRYNGTSWINLGVIASVDIATSTVAGIIKGGSNVIVDVDGTIHVDDVSDSISTFTESLTIANVVSGDTHLTLWGKVMKFFNFIGTTVLTTVAQTITGAINELKGNVGDLTQLETTSNTDLVGAVNEVSLQASSTANIGTFTGRTTQTATTYITIATAFPSVTLTEVQALNSTATLLDSADWYIIQKSIKEKDHSIMDSGYYYLTKTIKKGNKKILEGQGIFTTTLIKCHSGVGIAEIHDNRTVGDSGTDQCANPTLKNFYIAPSPAFLNQGVGISVDRAYQVNMERVFSHRHNINLDLKSVILSTFYGCSFQLGDIGLTTHGQCNVLTFINTLFSNCTTEGVHIYDNLTNITFLNCNFETSYRPATIQGGASGIVFDTCYSEGNTKGFALLDAGAVRIENLNWYNPVTPISIIDPTEFKCTSLDIIEPIVYNNENAGVSCNFVKTNGNGVCNVLSMKQKSIYDVSNYSSHKGKPFINWFNWKGATSEFTSGSITSFTNDEGLTGYIFEATGSTRTVKSSTVGTQKNGYMTMTALVKAYKLADGNTPRVAMMLGTDNTDLTSGYILKYFDIMEEDTMFLVSFTVQFKDGQTSFPTAQIGASKGKIAVHYCNVYKGKEIRLPLAPLFTQNNFKKAKSVEYIGGGQLVKLSTNIYPLTGTYKIGDLIENTNLTTGAYNLYSCTTAGCVADSWVAGTAYTEDDIIKNGSTYYYRCTKGGTSGTTAPSGFDTFTDGTCSWVYITAVTAVFATKI